MLHSEDNLPSSYKYAWSGDAELSLPDFLTKVSLNRLLAFVLLTQAFSLNRQWSKMTEPSP